MPPVAGMGAPSKVQEDSLGMPEQVRAMGPGKPKAWEMVTRTIAVWPAGRLSDVGERVRTKPGTAINSLSTGETAGRMAARETVSGWPG